MALLTALVGTGLLVWTAGAAYLGYRLGRWSERRASA